MTTLEKTLMETVKDIMMREHLTVSVAESITSGNLQTVLGSITGASNFYQGGVTAYSLERKVKLLGINRKHAREVDCVSQRVAREMAQGICKLFKTNIGIATTGYAEINTEAGVEQPVAFICICSVINDISTIELECEVDGDGLARIPMQESVTKFALEGLLDYLEKFGCTEPQ